MPDYKCNKFFANFFTLGCENTESWATIFVVSLIGLLMFAVLFKRYKKDKMIMANMIYFASLAGLALIYGVVLYMGKNSKNLDTIRTVGSVIKGVALIVLIFILYETYRPPNDKFTNTLFGKKKDDDKNKV